jgi:hypothetical protein
VNASTPLRRLPGPFSAGPVRIIHGETAGSSSLIIEDLGDRYCIRVLGCVGFEIAQVLVRSLDPAGRSAQPAAAWLHLSAGVPRRQTLRALGRLYAEQVAADVIAAVAA